MLNENPVNMFYDPVLDRKMVKYGYIVLPFLDENDITSFKSLYKKWHPKSPDEFYKSYFDTRIEYKEEVEKSIISIFEQKMATIFKNYDAFGGLFVVKPPTDKGHLPPHQDWSFVNEKEKWSINMWCPLDDVNDTNGNLTILKGSHQFTETIRGSGTPDIYREHQELIEKNMTSIPMKAGEAIFFFHGLIHGSKQNRTDKSRVCLGLTLTPKDSGLLYHYLDKSTNQLEQFKTTPDFYINYAANRIEKPKIKGSQHNFEFKGFTQDELLLKIKLANQPENHTTGSMNNSSNWIQRIINRLLK